MLDSLSIDVIEGETIDHLGQVLSLSIKPHCITITSLTTNNVSRHRRHTGAHKRTQGQIASGGFVGRLLPWRCRRLDSRALPGQTTTALRTATAIWFEGVVVAACPCHSPLRRQRTCGFNGCQNMPWIRTLGSLPHRECHNANHPSRNTTQNVQWDRANVNERPVASTTTLLSRVR